MRKLLFDTHVPVPHRTTILEGLPKWGIKPHEVETAPVDGYTGYTLQHRDVLAIATVNLHGLGSTNARGQAFVPHRSAVATTHPPAYFMVGVLAAPPILVLKTLIHEVGHILGVRGHCVNPTCLMHVPDDLAGLLSRQDFCFTCLDIITRLNPAV